MGSWYVGLFNAVAGQRTYLWYIIGIKHVGLCQGVAAAKKDLLVVCNGCQVYGVIPSCSIGKEGPADGL